jgi:hypothetical protein
LPIEGIFPPGQHQIVVRAPGLPEQSRLANVVAGQRVAIEVDFSVASRAAAAMISKPEDSEDGSDVDQTPRPGRQRSAPTFRSKEDYERAKDAAYDRFDSRWEARKNALKRQKDYYDDQIDHSNGPMKDRWKRKKEEVERQLDELDDQKDAAKNALKRQWNDD